MATEVNLPALGESVTEGTVTRWLKQVGDQVAVDEPLLEVSTDKVDTEIPSPVAGTLLEIKANEDDTVEVGAVLGVIGEEGEGDAAPTRRLRRPSPAEDDEPAADEAESDDDRRRGGRAAGARDREPSRGAEPEPDEATAEEPDAAGAGARQQAPTAAGVRRRSGGGRWRRTPVTLPALGRVGDRGHRHPLAQAGRRRGRRRRAAARGLHRQGRHRDPLPRGRHAARDQGQRGRDRRGRRRAGA